MSMTQNEFEVGTKVQIRADLLEEVEWETSYVATVLEVGEGIAGNAIVKVQWGEDFFGDPEQWLDPDLLQLAEGCEI